MVIFPLWTLQFLHTGLVVVGAVGDDVVGKARPDLLLPLVAAVVGATVLQGLTSFALVQLVSKEAQRLIAEMRTRVQEHVGRVHSSTG